VWEEELVPLLQRSPGLTPITLLEHLQRQKPDVDWIPLQRTLQRRVRKWKALHGPDPEVIFPLSYEPGEITFCDFTQLKDVEVTIAGQVFPHLLFHYRLAQGIYTTSGDASLNMSLGSGRIQAGIQSFPY
jgi:hypothetical protein